MPAPRPTPQLHERLETMGALQLKAVLGKEGALDAATLSFTTTDINAALAITGAVVQKVGIGSGGCGVCALACVRVRLFILFNIIMGNGGARGSRSWSSAVLSNNPAAHAVLACAPLWHAQGTDRSAMLAIVASETERVASWSRLEVRLFHLT